MVLNLVGIEDECKVVDPNKVIICSLQQINYRKYSIEMNKEIRWNWPENATHIL